MKMVILCLIFAGLVVVQGQECNQQMQICAPISSIPPGMQHPAVSRAGDVIQLKKELDKVIKRLDTMSSTASGSKRCLLSSYTFPRSRRTSDFARFRRYVPTLSSGTACMWVNASDLSHDFGIFSYAANPRMYNNFLLFYRRTRRAIGFHIGTGNVDLSIELRSGEMTHICGWFDSATRRLGMYVNGRTDGPVSYAGSVVTGGGSLVLAQDQDGIASGFDAAQAMTGTIENAMMWPRVLTESEIVEMAQDCICPPGHVLAMTVDKMELYGDATYRIPETCQILR